MTSYSYKTLNNTKTPILNNVDIVLILAMEDNNRFDEDIFLLSLAKKTIIQYNKGFRKSAKPPTITEPKYDIVHAYYTAFEYLKEYNNVTYNNTTSDLFSPLSHMYHQSSATSAKILFFLCITFFA